MKKLKHFIIQTVGVCTGTARTLYRKLCERISRFLKRKEPVSQPETVEDIFLREWTSVLTENARVFNGLFNDLKRIQSGTAKSRKRFCASGTSAPITDGKMNRWTLSARSRSYPLIKAEDRESLTKWAYSSGCSSQYHERRGEKSWQKTGRYKSGFRKKNIV